MRKLKLQMNITIDGFVGRADGDLSWVMFDWDPELWREAVINLDSVDCILLAMGRNSKMFFVPYWAEVATKPNDPSYAYGKKITETPKVVLSNTLTQSEWPLTRVINGDFVQETRRLKEGEGGDIMVVGGARFASTLLKNHLVDEIHLLVNPVALGSGLPIFGEIESKQALTMVKAKLFSCGVVWLHYEPT